MEKSPYEIRLELLKLAAEHLRDRYFWEKEPVDAEYDTLMSNETGLGTDGVKRLTYDERLKEVRRIRGLNPKSPTIDDIMREAAKLRQFVDAKTGGKPGPKVLLNEEGSVISFMKE